MFVLGGLMCALFGAIEDVFAWVAGKIRREDAAPVAAGTETTDA